MEIIRIEGSLERSQIDGQEVKELPAGLRKRMIQVLAGLKGVKKVHISADPENTIFERAQTNVTLDCLSQSKRKTFLETIALLEWYLAPHFYSSNPRAIGASCYCRECPTTGYPVNFGEYCSSWHCSSHEKWRAVIGPSYQPPERPKPLEPDPELAEQYAADIAKKRKELEEKGQDDRPMWPRVKKKTR